MAHFEHESSSATSELPAATSIELAAGGGIAEAACALAAVVLSILGIGGILPGSMMSVACIAVGTALMFAGGAVASRYSKQLESVFRGRSQTAGVAWGGVAAEAIAGVAGVVLGIIALLGTSSVTLVAIANIVFGAGLLIGGGAPSQVGGIPQFYQRADVERVTREPVFASAGGQLLVGVGAIALGVLALLNLAPTILNLVALLMLGGSLVVGGTAIGARMFSVLHRA
jgi:hypothetical protein